MGCEAQLDPRAASTTYLRSPTLCGRGAMTGGFEMTAGKDLFGAATTLTTSHGSHTAYRLGAEARAFGRRKHSDPSCCSRGRWSGSRRRWPCRCVMRSRGRPSLMTRHHRRGGGGSSPWSFPTVQWLAVPPSGARVSVSRMVAFATGRAAHPSGVRPPRGGVLVTIASPPPARAPAEPDHQSQRKTTPLFDPV